MHDLSVLWLRAAVFFYFIGLLQALTVLVRKRPLHFPLAFGAFCIGVGLHVVSIIGEAYLAGQIPANDFYESMSLFGALFALAFLFVYWRYRYQSLSVFIFPLVFVLTLVGTLGAVRDPFDEPPLRDAWLLVHVVLILLGYAALLLTVVASMVYLLHEWQLKQKRVGALARLLPPLVSTDSLIHLAMTWGFVFMTAGVLTGVTWAYFEAGTKWILDAKVAIALATWFSYLTMVFLRVAAGWRGRKAAILVLCVAAFSAVTWATHGGVGKLLEQ
jgi:ABC-type uncharacterized transport system permease subunit